MLGGTRDKERIGLGLIHTYINNEKKTCKVDFYALR